MVRTRWNKVVRDLWANKTRTALIVLSVGAGLFATGMILNAEVLLDEGLHGGYEAIHASSGIIRTNPVFAEDFLQTVRGIEGVADADARVHYITRFQFLPAAEQGAETSAVDGARTWKDVQIFAVPDYDAMRVNRIAPQQGSWPPPEHELLIERSSAAMLGAREGDRLIVETPGGGTRTIRIAGTVHDLIQLPAQLDGSVYVYVSFNTLEWLGLPRGLNELNILVDHPEDAAATQAVVGRVKDAVEAHGMAIPMDAAANPNDLPLGDVLEVILYFLGGLGFLSLGLSAFLIVNTVSALVTQQVRQIGVMKAVGARAGQIMAMYLALAALYGAIALLAAVPLGILGAWALSAGLAGMFNFDLNGFRIVPQVIGLQILIGIAVPVIAALIPVAGVLRISAAEAMRDYGTGNDKFGRGWLERNLLMNGALTRWLPRPVLLSLRNTFRRRGRLALTIGALTLGGAIFIGILSVQSSLKRAMDAIVPYQFDLSVMLAQPQGKERIEALALESANVREAHGWAQMSVRRVRADGSEGQNIYLLVPPIEENLVVPTMVEGRWLTPEDDHAIVISSGMRQNDPDLGVGGEMVLKLGGQAVSFRIVGMALGMGMVPTAYAGYEDVSRILQSEGSATYLMIVTGRPDPVDQARDAAALEEHLTQAGIPVRSIQLMTEETAEIRNIIDIILGLALVMAMLLAVVGGLGLAGTLSINVLERTREVGMMRAIGASDSAVARIFIVEGEVIGLISALLGLLAAIPLGGFLGREIGMALLQTPLTSASPLPGAGLWLIIVIIVAALSSFWPARNASRLTVRDVLAYE
jgi:putative ABC transport system permease protein